MMAWQVSCSSAPRQGCEKHIKEKIQPGVPLKAAESELKNCGFKITVDASAKTLYGDKVVQGVPVSERTQVLIKLDSSNKVAEANVTSGLIGP
jgi:hypothetical protein